MVPSIETDQDMVGVAIQQLYHVCGIPDVKQGEGEVDVGGSRHPNGPIADPPCGVGVRKVRGIDHRRHGRIIPTAGANESCRRQKGTGPQPGAQPQGSLSNLLQTKLF